MWRDLLFGSWRAICFEDVSYSVEDLPGPSAMAGLGIWEIMRLWNCYLSLAQKNL